MHPLDTTYMQATHIYLQADTGAKVDFSLIIRNTFRMAMNWDPWLTNKQPGKTSWHHIRKIEVLIRGPQTKNIHHSICFLSCSTVNSPRVLSSSFAPCVCMQDIIRSMLRLFLLRCIMLNISYCLCIVLCFRWIFVTDYCLEENACSQR